MNDYHNVHRNQMDYNVLVGNGVAYHKQQDKRKIGSANGFGYQNNYQAQASNGNQPSERLSENRGADYYI